MIINTTSKQAMETDLANYLDISIEELYQYIDYASEKAQMDSFCFREDIFFQELNCIISDLQSDSIIDNVYCYHLTRLLNTSVESLNFSNLKDLLLSENVFSNFLRDFNITFFEQEEGIFFTCNGVEFSFYNTENNAANYLRARLHYNDYCFNGFAFRDQLLKNSYARQLYDGPEFLQRLSEYLRKPQIINRYKQNSELNASRSVMQDSSLVQSLNFSKVSFCFSVSPAFSSSSFLHISLTSLSTLVPRLIYLSCGLMLP